MASIQNSLIILVCIAGIVSGGSPPSSFNKKPNSKFKSLKGIWLDNIRNKNPTNVPLEHQTRSDAMQLYSIRSKQIVKVKEVSEKAWEQPNYELTMTPKSRSRRDNKFVTETVSYQRLKIRSADNQKYLCARTNGEIVFKDTADKEEKVASVPDGLREYSSNKADKKNKPRKRCLFHWEFTKQMHIQLSLEAGDKKRYYLSVKDNLIKLREKEETTEIERSFIWLPTKPLKGQGTRLPMSGNERRSRTFDFDLDAVFGKMFPEEILREKDRQIELLLEEVRNLKGKASESDCDKRK
ncbi:uncharacterized protein [Clytia hemisphaerica]|uniref:Cnidarian restricted protein n=1 Tax=Clytia hemisphaerica TaxID=252671 RepID=A0A7M5XEC7_9CNID|eukprot:TCONS_00053035-protein